MTTKHDDMTPPGAQSRHTDVIDAVIVGAGFSGLYMLYRLKHHLGLSARIIEAGSDVGGTWYWNRYPGARCDSESYVYCYSFSDELLREWEWSGRYPEQPEIFAYLRHVADRFKLRDDITFDTRVVSAAFDEQTNLWEVWTDSGERLLARFFITAVGILASAPYTPNLLGLADFGGETFHTGKWPKTGVDFAGKSVGIIGTGSSGVQAIPVIAESADQLYVFQRTPQYTVPARHEALTDDRRQWIRNHYDEIWAKARWSVGGYPWQHNGKSALEASPEERLSLFESLWREGGFHFVFGSYKDILTDRRANDFVASFVRSKIRETVTDPLTAESLLPVDYPFGARRPVVDTNYFETYNRPNVTLLDLRISPIQRVTGAGIQTTDGEVPLDIIVFATGFDAITGPFLRMDIRGRAGALAAHWKDGPTSYLGLAISGYPNMFMIVGPGSMFANYPVALEHHVEWIAACIERTLMSGKETVEVDSEAEVAWMAHLDAQADRSLVPLADSWFTGANIPDKATSAVLYFGSFGVYRQTCDEVAAEDYRGFTFS